MNNILWSNVNVFFFEWPLSVPDTIMFAHILFLFPSIRQSIIYMSVCHSCDSISHLLAFECSSYSLTYFWSASQIVFILKPDFITMAVPTNTNENSVQTLPEEIQVISRLILILLIPSKKQKFGKLNQEKLNFNYFSCRNSWTMLWWERYMLISADAVYRKRLWMCLLHRSANWNKLSFGNRMIYQIVYHQIS